MGKDEFVQGGRRGTFELGHQVFPLFRTRIQDLFGATTTATALADRKKVSPLTRVGNVVVFRVHLDVARGVATLVQEADFGIPRCGKDIFENDNERLRLADPVHHAKKGLSALSLVINFFL